jgi:methyl-accepting chemotaxis protein
LPAAFRFSCFIAGLYLFRRRAVLPLTDDEGLHGQVLSAGDYSKEVPHAERKDEIGEMAQSVAHSSARPLWIGRKLAALSEKQQAEIQRLEEEAAERQAAEDAERVRVIEALTTGLENLSAGQPRLPDRRPLHRTTRSCAPSSTARRRKAQRNHSGDRVTTEAVRLSSSEIGTSADDLSKRTEQQAASLEETAAALDEITSTVKSSSAARRRSKRNGRRGQGRCRKIGQGGRQNAISAMEQDRGILGPDQPDHLGDRRHRLPDQPAGAQCRRGSGTRR